MDHMFYNCSSLVFLNLRHFLKDNLTYINEIFGQLAEGVKYCLEDLPTRGIIFYQGGISVCDDTCFTIRKPKIDMSNKKCLNSCSESISNKFEYFNACYNKCPKGTLLDGFQCTNNECKGKPNSAYCKDETPVGYYLDTSDEIYKKCYEKCKYCHGEGNEANHNCKECISGYGLISNPLDIINCYENCPYYYYFDNSNNYHCTIGNECPSPYTKFIEEKGQCVYEEIIVTTQEKEESTIVIEPTTEFIPETTSKISRITTQIDTTSLGTTIITSIADTTAGITTIADTTAGITTIADTTVGITTIANTTTGITTIIGTTAGITTITDTTAGIISTNVLSSAISPIVYSSIAISSSTIYSTALESTDISSTTPYEIDTTYKTKNRISSSELGISTINLESDINLVTSTASMEKYGCLSNPLLLRCSMAQISNNTQIYNLLVNDILSMYKGSNEKSMVFEGDDDTIFQVTSAKNELELLMNSNISENYNISIIDFSECEKILKEHYHIAEEDSLIFIKQEKKTGEKSEKNIQYECYEPYNKTKLNLSLCSGVSINIYVPLILSDEAKKLAEQMKKLGYDIFDLNDRFYQDMCTPYTTKFGTDIILLDRIEYIYNALDAQCQSNCKFSNYALEAKYINCDCNVSDETSNEIQVKKMDKFEPKSTYEMFYFTLKYSNYKVLLCYKLVFVKRVLTENLGSILVLILFSLYLIFLFIYICRGTLPLKIMLRPIIVDKDKIIHLYFPPKKKKSTIKNKGKDSKKNLNNIETEIYSNTKEDNKKDKKKNKNKNSKIKKRNKKDLNIIPFEENTDYKKTKTNRFLNKQGFKSKSSKAILKESKNKIREKKKKSKFKEIEIIEKPEKPLDDFELNELEYNEAVEKDKRNGFRIYFSYLKREHRVIFSFFYCSDYNLVSVKISRFIFLFVTDMALNVFFFSHVTMHKMYIDYGKYDLVYQIPQIIYSTIASQLIEVFLCFLSLTDKYIYQIKNLEGKEKNRKNIDKIFKCIKIKLVCYFVFTFIFFGFFWYTVAAFCAVYQNTQKAFIKDSLMSFLLSLIYPFILYSFPTLLRLIAIRCTKINLEWMYKLSEVIPFF